MLFASNLFMTFAWYGHLKFPHRPLILVILTSWGIALFEYCLAVPANRLGHQVYSLAALKTIQEIVTRLAWNHAVGFAFLVIAAFFIFKRW